MAKTIRKEIERDRDLMLQGVREIRHGRTGGPEAFAKELSPEARLAAKREQMRRDLNQYGVIDVDSR